ncbi:hypothetical protein LTR66_015481, partial [Elasticomyces elasticus]
MAPKSAGWFTSPKSTGAAARKTPNGRPTTSDGLAPHDVSSVQQSVQAAADKPVAKKKKKSILGAEGSHLASESMTAGPTGTAVGSNATAARQASAHSIAYLSPAQSDSEDLLVTKKKKRIVVPPIDTSTPSQVPEPPPRSPLRAMSPTQSPIVRPPQSPTIRASGYLHKQPSIVREDPEGEEEEAHVAGAITSRNSENNRTVPSAMERTGKVITTSAGPAVAYVASTAQHNRSVSQPALSVPSAATPTSGSRKRVGSLSPGRSAHFAAGLVVDSSGGVKHNPPPRSVSPAKSALKHSPAPSVTNNSPRTSYTGNRPKPPGSDGSDTTSLASQDGDKSAKKKRNVRVSFDNDATAIPHSAGSAASNSPMSPAFGARGILPSGRTTFHPAAAEGDQEDELMKPRPTLPSFGSVRGNKSRENPIEHAQKVTETVPSSMETSTGTLPDQYQLSNDQVIGAVLASHQASVSARHMQPAPQAKMRDSSPLPASSKEATGNSSDEDEEHDSRGKQLDSHESNNGSQSTHTSALNPTHAKVNAIMDDSDADADVPAINILPATPGLDEDAKQLEPAWREEHFAVPGGWGEEQRTASHEIVEHHATDPTPATVGISEPTPVEEHTSTRAGTLSQEAETHSPILNAIDESDSDDSAIYSDAAEDLSDLEDGGFASLDAIVESPMAPYAPGIPITTPPESPKVAAPVNKQPLVTAARSDTHATAGESGDWGQATAYWSSLSKQRRQQLEREHFSSDDEAKPAPAVVKKPKKKKVKQQTALAAPQQADQPQQTRTQPKKVSTEQEPKHGAPAIRQSMRSTPGHAPVENETHMRRSMRSDGMMRTSMRGAENRSPRPSSEYQDRDPPRMKNVRPASAGRPTATKPPTSAVATASLQNQAAQKSVQPGPPPPTRKTFSNDSDSESSFKKRRRPSVSASDAGGKYTMKRSMRSASVDDSRPISPLPASTRGAGKLSLRSMSPTGSFLGRSTMRTSMRASVDSTTPTLRNPDRTRSPPRFGMSAFSKPKPVPAQQPAARAAPAKKMFKSRFADSDSDGDAPASRGGQR